MADEPQPVSQEVEEKETIDEDAVQETESKSGWLEAIPGPIRGLIPEHLRDDAAGGLDWLADNIDNNPIFSLFADKIADYKQQLRDIKDDVLGPQQISFAVKPKAKLRNDDRNYAHTESLRFPEDTKLSDTEYMLFQFFRYEPPFGRGGVGDLQLNRVFQAQGLGEYGTLEEYNLATTNMSPDTQLNQVVLFMPPDITSVYKASWGDQSFSNTAVAKIRGGMALRRGNVLRSLAGQAANLSNSIARAPDIMGADFMREQIAKSGGDQLSRNALFSSAAGAILNPNTELLFKNPGMRGISFTFKMVPNNRNEAEIVYEIVKTFKKCLHPTYGPPGRQQGKLGQGRGPGATDIAGDARGKTGFISVPSVCKFAFMKGGELHPYLPQFKTCALTDVDVNYTTDGAYVVTKDGFPVATELKLTFKELKLIYREDIGGHDTVKTGPNKRLHGGY